MRSIPGLERVVDTETLKRPVLANADGQRPVKVSHADGTEIAMAMPAASRTLGGPRFTRHRLRPSARPLQRLAEAAQLEA